MKGMLAPLSPHEETALRKIAVGSDCLDPVHVRRLHQLGLVGKDDGTWRLTALGARRHDLLMNATDASAA